MKKKLSTILVVTAAAFSFSATAFAADYGNAWTHTDFTSNTAGILNMSVADLPSDGGLRFYMYDFVNPNGHVADVMIFDNPVDGLGLFDASIQFSRTAVDQPWTTVTTTTDLQSGSSTSNFLALSPAGKVGFYFSDGAQVYGYTTTDLGGGSYGLDPVGYNGSYQVSLNTTDLAPAPVPLPGAALLLGSGLLSLTGLRRRNG